MGVETNKGKLFRIIDFSVFLLPPYGGMENCTLLQFYAVQYGLVMACLLGDGVCGESALAGLPLGVVAQPGSA